MSWNPLSAPVDYVLLGGQRSPGLATIDGASSPRQWDERRGRGTTGATVVFQGIKLAKFTLSIRLITVEDWDAWDSWRQVVQRPPSGQRPRALDIDHPITEMLGIRSVVVEDVGQPKQTGDGEWTIEIKLIEFRPPTPAIARPEASVDQPNAPTDPVDQVIERLTAQLQELAQ